MGGGGVVAVGQNGPILASKGRQVAVSYTKPAKGWVGVGVGGHKCVLWRVKRSTINCNNKKFMNNKN